ncbi:UDP-N-acetylmuramate dehydrogenase [Gemmiger sp.]
MQEQTITALRTALTAQQLPFAQGEPLAPHTTFKIGGPAAFWCTPQDAEQLRRTLQLCRENGVRVYLLGNGSNTLFDDAGFDGAVIDMRGLSGMEGSDLDADAVRITAGAGQTLGRLCSKAQTLGLTGLEFACGIPGTVGGAVYMNAGAYGSELKDVLESVTFLDSDLQLRTLPAADLAMGYRTSIFEQNPDWCILSATVVLHRGDGAAVLARMQELLGKRRDKQPLEWPSAGSTFKRPQGAFAGKLIEDCGLRGFTVGGAQISEKHCGFVINRGGATCADVVTLTEQVRQIVEARTGFVLEREIRVVK